MLGRGEFLEHAPRRRHDVASSPLVAAAQAQTHETGALCGIVSEM